MAPLNFASLASLALGAALNAFFHVEGGTHAPRNAGKFQASKVKPLLRIYQMVLQVTRLSHAEFGHKSVYTNDRWDTPELVLSARTLGLSIAQPRLSPDGRWLFFCGTAYGCWPVYVPDSDLYAIDLHTGGNGAEFAWRKLEINSPECESWLSWSSNSRWVVFSTKRMSPLFSRPHLAYVGADGRCGKPFVLPQRDPTFYDSQLLTYTIPTLATGPGAGFAGGARQSNQERTSPGFAAPMTPASDEARSLGIWKHAGRLRR